MPLEDIEYGLTELRKQGAFKVNDSFSRKDFKKRQSRAISE